MSRPVVSAGRGWWYRAAVELPGHGLGWRYGTPTQDEQAARKEADGMLAQGSVWIYSAMCLDAEHAAERLHWSGRVPRTPWPQEESQWLRRQNARAG